MVSAKRSASFVHPSPISQRAIWLLALRFAPACRRMTGKCVSSGRVTEFFPASGCDDATAAQMGRSITVTCFICCKGISPGIASAMSQSPASSAVPIRAIDSCRTRSSTSG